MQASINHHPTLVSASNTIPVCVAGKVHVDLILLKERCNAVALEEGKNTTDLSGRKLSPEFRETDDDLRPKSKGERRVPHVQPGDQPPTTEGRSRLEQSGQLAAMDRGSHRCALRQPLESRSPS